MFLVVVVLLPLTFLCMLHVHVTKCLCRWFVFCVKHQHKVNMVKVSGVSGEGERNVLSSFNVARDAFSKFLF